MSDCIRARRAVGFGVGIAPHLTQKSPTSEARIRPVTPAKDLVLQEGEV